MIASSVVQSYAPTLIHNAILANQDAFLTIIASNELKNMLVLVGSHINFYSMQCAFKYMLWITSVELCNFESEI